MAMKRLVIGVARHPARGALGLALILGGFLVIAAALITPAYVSALLHR